MSIKVQHQEMIMSAKRINAQTEKLNHIQRELQTMLNSTDWDMRVRRSMESRLEETRKLNRELTLIVKNMSQMVDKTAESMKEKDRQLANITDREVNSSNSISNSSNSLDISNSGDVEDDGFGFMKSDADIKVQGFVNGEPSVSANIGGAVLDYKDKWLFGTEDFGISFGIEASAGSVGAKAEAAVDILEGDFYAGAAAGAYVGEGDLDITLNLGPVELTLSPGIGYGLGAGGHAGFQDGKFGAGIHAGVGPAFGVSFGAGINKEWEKWDNIFNKTN